MDELCVCLLVLIYPVTFVGRQCVPLALRSVQFTLEAPRQEDQDQGSDGKQLYLLWTLEVRFGFLPYRMHERTTASSAWNSFGHAAYLELCIYHPQGQAAELQQETSGALTGLPGIMPCICGFVAVSKEPVQRAKAVKFRKREGGRELSFEMVQNMFLSIEICKSEFSFVSVCWVF